MRLRFKNKKFGVLFIPRKTWNNSDSFKIIRLSESCKDGKIIFASNNLIDCKDFINSKVRYELWCTAENIMKIRLSTYGTISGDYLGSFNSYDDAVKFVAEKYFFKEKNNEKELYNR